LIERRAGFTKKDRAIVFRGTFLADSFTTITNDARFKRNLRERNIPLTEFLDIDRLREIFSRYNGRRFGDGL
jgi:hypothetical protein